MFVLIFISNIIQDQNLNMIKTNPDNRPDQAPNIIETNPDNHPDQHIDMIKTNPDNPYIKEMIKLQLTHTK